MGKSNVLFIKFLLVFFLAISCQEDEPSIGNIVAPSNIAINVDVAEDRSGNVTVTPTGDNVLNFQIFSEAGDPVSLSNGESTVIRFTESGQYSTTITAVAFGTGGLSSSSAVTIDLDVQLRISPELLAIIAGGDGVAASSKSWIWNQSVGGHFGVGPLTNDFPEFFSAGPSQLDPCIYDDVLTFSHDGNDNYTFTLDPGPDNLTFINWTEVNRFFANASPQQFVDECRDITSQADFTSSFVILENGDGTMSLDLGGSFLSYWVVVTGQYRIENFDTNELSFRGLSQPFNGDDPLAWYSTFVPRDMADQNSNGGVLQTQFNNLIWSDEFNVNGAPDPNNWQYDLGNGENGWGNQEAQFYTDEPENVIVQDGNLRIMAKTENGSGPDIYFYDDFQLVNPTNGDFQVVEDFEGAAPSFTGFEGASSEVVNNPDASGSNTSSMVAQFTKNVGAEFFAGTFFDLPSPLDLSTRNSLSLKTWSPKEGAVVRIKVENTNNSAEFVEIDATTTVANSWEELSYDLSNAPNFNYDRIVVFFDFGEEGPMPAGFTSARIRTQDLQEFTYGRVEARAKLPVGVGTWPAIWMLGADFEVNPWPAAGEMDIMEHVGRQQDVIFGTTHDPTAFGGDGRSGSLFVEGVSEEFHIYEMEWTANEIQFAVDGQVYHVVPNDSSKPFNKDFFFIINLAMGGTFGGDIDGGFIESSIEVDYIRMYQ